MTRKVKKAAKSKKSKKPEVRYGIIATGDYGNSQSANSLAQAKRDGMKRLCRTVSSGYGTSQVIIYKMIPIARASSTDLMEGANGIWTEIGGAK